MSRVAQLALLVTLASCSTDTHPPSACDLKQKIAERLDQTHALDCGELEQDASLAQREQARACVLSAMQAKSAFKLIVHQGDPHPGFADAYVYAGGDALVSILHYDPGPVNGGKRAQEIHGEACSFLRASADCDLSAAGQLCLTCDTLLESNISCNAASADGACRGLGNYQAGKEGSYRPCCSGLVEVFQQTRVESEGVASCSHVPLRVYACIEGACGDGRCEAPENVPCGCKLDCPAVTPAP